MTSLTPLLTISDLHLNFNTVRGPQSILCGVDLQIGKGESLGLVGESGCGKSVTAQAIMGLLGPSSCITNGEIVFQDEKIHAKTNREMQEVRGKKIGMVFQDPMTSLNPTLTIGWQIAESLVYHEGYTHRDARKRAIELLELVDISDPETRYSAYPFQLSGGMRQRVMIAMALACNPALLIADEPTTALDVTVQAEILDLIQRVREKTGMALLLITHDLGIVAGTCDRMAVMHKGTIVETAIVETLFASPQHPYTRTLLSAWQGKLFI